VDRERLRGLGWDLVRRPTGGRAILHTAELTYSVIAPMSEPRVVGGVIESYRQLSAGLMQGVELLGLNVRAEKNPKSSQTPEAERRGQIPNPNLQSPEHPSTPSPNPVCFETSSDYEITANGRKLLGSAQVRKQGVVLQHGTLPLTGDVARIVEVLRVDSEKERARLRERVHWRATTVEEVLGRAVTWAEAVAALQQGFAEKLNLSFEERGLTEREVELTAQLRAEKYAAERWNARV
jgi:lipoate-protein ligase A